MIRWRWESAATSGGTVGSRTLEAISALECFCIKSDPTQSSHGTTVAPKYDSFLFAGWGGRWTNWLLGRAAAVAAGRLGARVGQLAGVMELVAQRGDHGADHQRQAEHVEPEQGDQDEAEGRAESREAGDAREVDREEPVGQP